MKNTTDIPNAGDAALIARRVALTGSTSATGSSTQLCGRQLLAEVPSTKESRGEWLRAIARDEALALEKANALGIPNPELDVAFSSIFDPRFKAYLQRGGNDEIVYHDLTFAGTKTEYLPLPSVLASKINHGTPVSLPKRHILEWHLRLLVAADLLPPAPVQLPQLPEFYNHGDTRTAYDGLRALFECRWILDYGIPRPYSNRFAATWCGLTIPRAARAVEKLRELSIVIPVGSIPSQFSNPTFLYLPGQVHTPVAEEMSWS